MMITQLFHAIFSNKFSTVNHRLTSRRRVLTAVGTGVTVVLAGCSSNGQENSQSGGSDSDGTEQDDGSNSGQLGSGNGDASDEPEETGGPEGAVKQLFTAYQQKDVEKVNEIIYGTNLTKKELENSGKFELVSAKELSSAEVAEGDYRDFGRDTTEGELQQSKQEIKTKSGADEVAYVLAKFRTDGETTKTIYIVIKIKTDWKVIQ